MKTKKSPEISLSIQKTFVVIVISLYLLHLITAMQSYLSVPNVYIAFNNFPTHLIDIVVLPVVLFTLGYVYLKSKASKVTRLFDASLLAYVGVILSGACSGLFIALFRTQLGYSITPGDWTSPWYQLLPTIFSLVVMTCIAIFILKPAQKNEFSSSRVVQQTLIIIVVVSFLVSSLATSYSISANAYDGGFGTLNDTFAFLLTMIGTIAIPSIILYLTASKKRSKLSRLFIAMIYMLVGLSLFMLLGTVVFSLDTYLNQQGALSGNIITPVLALVAFVSIVTIQKIRKDF